jgi:hypothetical protein
MFLQKGIGFVLEQQLKRRFKIDLSQQPKLNRQLARRGSIDGSFGTIDLSSASDSVSLKMLRLILPDELLFWLELARSPHVIFPDGTSNELHMVSSMGNGFTFPLESLIFSTIVVACYRTLGISPSYDHNGPTNWAVFGDDIIVRKDAYDFVVRTLKMFGFVVNDQKSFNSGYFRESCGGDYFRGHNIRGVYCKSLKTSADVYSAINRLIRWSTESGVVLTKTLSMLKRKVDYLPIPFHDGDAEGIKTPYPPIGLHRDRNGSVKYKALAKVSDSIRMPISDDQQLYFRHYKRRRETFYNASGLMVALVGGAIRNGRVSVRNSTDKFKIRHRVTPCWTTWRTIAPLKTPEEIERFLKDRDLRNALRPYMQDLVPLSVGLTSLEGDWELTFDLYS